MDNNNHTNFHHQNQHNQNHNTISNSNLNMNHNNHHNNDLSSSSSTISPSSSSSSFITTSTAAAAATTSHTIDLNVAKNSCKHCRESHRKCDRTLPHCHQCTKRGLQCVYEPSKKRRSRAAMIEQQQQQQQQSGSMMTQNFEKDAKMMKMSHGYPMQQISQQQPQFHTIAPQLAPQLFQQVQQQVPVQHQQNPYDFQQQLTQQLASQLAPQQLQQPQQQQQDLLLSSHQQNLLIQAAAQLQAQQQQAQAQQAQQQLNSILSTNHHPQQQQQQYTSLLAQQQQQQALPNNNNNNYQSLLQQAQVQAQTQVPPPIITPPPPQQQIQQTPPQLMTEDIIQQQLRAQVVNLIQQAQQQTSMNHNNNNHNNNQNNHHQPHTLSHTSPVNNLELLNQALAQPPVVQQQQQQSSFSISSSNNNLSAPTKSISPTSQSLSTTTAVVSNGDGGAASLFHLPPLDENHIQNVLDLCFHFLPSSHQASLVAQVLLKESQMSQPSSPEQLVRTSLNTAGSSSNLVMVVKDDEAHVSKSRKQRKQRKLRNNKRASSENREEENEPEDENHHHHHDKDHYDDDGDGGGDSGGGDDDNDNHDPNMDYVERKASEAIWFASQAVLLHHLPAVERIEFVDPDMEIVFFNLMLDKVMTSFQLMENPQPLSPTSSLGARACFAFCEGEHEPSSSSSSSSLSASAAASVPSSPTTLLSRCSEQRQHLQQKLQEKLHCHHDNDGGGGDNDDNDSSSTPTRTKAKAFSMISSELCNPAQKQGQFVFPFSHLMHKLSRRVLLRMANHMYQLCREILLDPNIFPHLANHFKLAQACSVLVFYLMSVGEINSEIHLFLKSVKVFTDRAKGIMHEHYKIVVVNDVNDMSSGNGNGNGNGKNKKSMKIKASASNTSISSIDSNEETESVQSLVTDHMVDAYLGQKVLLFQENFNFSKKSIHKFIKLSLRSLNQRKTNNLPYVNLLATHQKEALIKLKKILSDIEGTSLMQWNKFITTCRELRTLVKFQDRNPRSIWNFFAMSFEMYALQAVCSDEANESIHRLLDTMQGNLANELIEMMMSNVSLSLFAGSRLRLFYEFITTIHLNNAKMLCMSISATKEELAESLKYLQMDSFIVDAVAAKHNNKRCRELHKELTKQIEHQKTLLDHDRHIDWRSQVPLITKRLHGDCVTRVAISSSSMPSSSSSSSSSLSTSSYGTSNGGTPTMETPKKASSLQDIDFDAHEFLMEFFEADQDFLSFDTLGRSNMN